MKRHNYIWSGVVATLLCSCSSPPPPPAVPEEVAAVAINNRMPDFADQHNVIPAPVVSGHWHTGITFTDSHQLWPPAVWFAVVHSTAITINAPDTAAYFSAKSWLQQHGATARVISFRHSPSFTGQTTLLFSR